MSEVIYRKYRPRTFAEVSGQKTIVKILIQAISQGKVGHAYLFSGPRGTGKTSLARLVAKAVNQPDFSSKKDIDPNSEVSKAIESGTFLDLIEIDAASNRGIEEIRMLREKVHFSPTQAKFKVYIIDEVHMLTREAFNALLKTLEEPPKHAIFIMATTEPHKVPVTILSRVQRLNFQPANRAELQSKITRIAEGEGLKISEDAVEILFNQSEGSYRDAESILEKVLASLDTKEKEIKGETFRKILGLAKGESVTEFIEVLVAGQIQLQLDYVRDLITNGVSLDNFITQVIEELKTRILKDIKSPDVKLIQVLNGLIGVVKDTQNDQDAQLMLEVFLINNALKSGDITAKLVSEKPKKEIVTHKVVKKEKTVKKLANSLAPKPDQLLKKAKKISFKAWTAVKVANFKLKGESLIVEVPNKEVEKILWEKTLLELVSEHFGTVKDKIEVKVVETDSKEKGTVQPKNGLVESNKELVENIL